MERDPIHYTYVLECGDGSIYVGQTDNLIRRLEEHQRKNKATSKNSPQHHGGVLRVVAVYISTSRTEAEQCEGLVAVLLKRRYGFWLRGVGWKCGWSSLVEKQPTPTYPQFVRLVLGRSYPPSQHCMHYVGRRYPHVRFHPRFINNCLHWLNTTIFTRYPWEYWSEKYASSKLSCQTKRKATNSTGNQHSVQSLCERRLGLDPSNVERPMAPERQAESCFAP
ncbi:MAG: GIY-YIG nuclease family protein [Nitrospira sp.]|nr:GIY-YIG nuclease family protein [Nitrospira sp.]